MRETRPPRLDPGRLREERHDADLGDAAGFDRVTLETDDEAAQPPQTDNSTAGVSPPAR